MWSTGICWRTDYYLLSLDSWMWLTWIDNISYCTISIWRITIPSKLLEMGLENSSDRKGFSIAWKGYLDSYLEMENRDEGKSSFMRLRTCLRQLTKCKHMGIDAFHITIFMLRIYFSFNEECVLSLLRKLGTQLI